LQLMRWMHELGRRRIHSRGRSLVDAGIGGGDYPGITPRGRQGVRKHCRTARRGSGRFRIVSGEARNLKILITFALHHVEFELDMLIELFDSQAHSATR
jgi:hypothetical protein